MQTIRPILISVALLHGAAGAVALEPSAPAKAATAQAMIPADSRGLHTVAEGESIADIATRFYNTERQLRFHNLMPEPQEVTAGQRLSIPEPSLRVPADWQRQYAEGRLSGHELNMHEVKRGETVSLIADSYGVDAAQLLRLNKLDNPDRLEVGTLLRLPDGAEMKQPVVVPRALRPIAITRDTPIGVYTVVRGDTLSLIATKHGIKAGHILAVNTLADPDRLEIGDRLMVPDPHRRLPPVGPVSEYTFMWPLDDYRAVSEFGGRGDREHRGIDMAASRGSSIRASADGTVIFAGVQQGYGNVVVVDHGSGVETLYAHNTRNLVKRGQEVLQGQSIATVGHTGNARGDHLHFEYIVDGDSKEPRDHIEQNRHDAG